MILLFLLLGGGRVVGWQAEKVTAYFQMKLQIVFLKNWPTKEYPRRDYSIKISKPSTI